MVQNEKLIEIINGSNSCLKINALKALVKRQKTDASLIPNKKEDVCVHYASKYYYSSFSPSFCAYAGYRAGNFGVGINDYASVGGFKEFKKASKILNIPYTYGYHLACEPLFKEDRAIVYGYGVSYEVSKSLNKDLEVYREKQKEIAFKYLEKVNSRLNKYKIQVTKKEVLKQSLYKKGGVLSEKHVFNVFAEKIIAKYGKGKEMVDLVVKILKIDNENKELAFLLESQNTFYADDLTKILFNNRDVFAVKEDLVLASEIININKKYGVISSYKIKPTNFDEQGLLKACEILKEKGFNAVTFDDRKIPSDKLDAIVDFFISNGLMPISLYRMGMPRQTGRQGDMPSILFDTAIAVIGNGISTAYNISDAMFGETTIQKCPDLKTRIELFKNVGKKGR